MRIKMLGLCDSCEAGPNVVDCDECMKVAQSAARLYRLGNHMAKAITEFGKQETQVDVGIDEEQES